MVVMETPKNQNGGQNGRQNGGQNGGLKVISEHFSFNCVNIRLIITHLHIFAFDIKKTIKWLSWKPNIKMADKMAAKICPKWRTNG